MGSPAPIQTPIAELTASGLAQLQNAGALAQPAQLMLAPIWQTWFVQSSSPQLWQNWTPVFTVAAPMTISGLGIANAQFLRLGALCIVQLRAAFTLGGTPSAIITPTLPVAVDGDFFPLQCLIAQPGANWNLGVAYTLPTLNQIQVMNDGGGNWGIGAASLFLGGCYRCVPG